MNSTSVVAAISREAGGLQNSVRRLHQCLNDLPDVNVRIVSLWDDYVEQDVHEWSPLSVMTFPVVGPRAFGYSPGLKAEVFADDGEIMHTHGIWQYPSVAVQAWHQRTGRPYLISTHGMLDPWALRNSAWKKRIALAFYERAHLEQAACLRALCESEAQAFRAFGLKNPVCIIPNGIDLPDDRGRTAEDGSQSSAIWPGASGRKVLLFLSRIHPKKGLVNLLRAWAAVQKPEGGGRKSEEWVLVIAGWDQGGHEAELMRLCDQLGIKWADVRGQRAEDRDTTSGFGPPASVLFLGPQFGGAKAACYAQCDAFILPSFSEGLPMVVLEAWAYGKPVWMTPECNLPEGFVANAAIRIEPDPKSIAEGLELLFQCPSAELQATGSRGRELVASRFTWPKIATDMKSVYDWVLGGGPKPGCVVLD